MMNDSHSNAVQPPIEVGGAVLEYLVSQARRVRFFTPRLELLWSNRPEGAGPSFAGENGAALPVPPEGEERERWPVSRVAAGMLRATRLYSGGEDHWRVTAWPIGEDENVLIVEETEHVDAPEAEGARFEQLDQDIEDLLHNVIDYLRNGSATNSLRLHNPHIHRCQKERGCQNPFCSAYANPSSGRCWEMPEMDALMSLAPEELLSKFRVCSHCRVFGLASPNPMIRISENFNRLISLLQFKYQETLDTQHRMQRADKLSIMGELLATIAHEIKNPLGIIMGRLDLIGLELDSLSPEDLGKDLATIYQQVNRVRQIIDHLLDMARPRPPVFEAVNLNNVVADCLAMVHKTLAEHGIEVETDLDRELPLIQADQIQTQQVLLNLILNARDAMPSGGKLAIRLAREGNGAGLAVTDTGCGIAPEQLGKLFSSFHTTKVNQGGTGLGLAVCRRIMRTHQGTIKAESTINQGTTMRLWFPMTSRPA